MTRSAAAPTAAPARTAPIEVASVLEVLPAPVVVIEAGDRVSYANPAAEQLFGASAKVLCAEGLGQAVTPNSPLLEVIAQVRRRGQATIERGATLRLAKRGATCLVDVQVAPDDKTESGVVVVLYERTFADKLDRQQQRQEAGRSVASMAATLAHEVRNPLSGIKGAAQLIGQQASEADRELTRLICDETDRIGRLIDRLEAFGDGPAMERRPANVHEILDHVLALARTGIARHVDLTAAYDPSLPMVDGNRDALVQVFLNLVKNAAEAVPKSGGEIVVRTAYQYGLSVVETGGAKRMHLPIAVSVQDNGDGIAEELRAHVFEPFVTTRTGGKGLGLALVAKIVADHGGLVDIETAPRRTEFRVLLPERRA